MRSKTSLTKVGIVFTLIVFNHKFKVFSTKHRVYATFTCLHYNKLEIRYKQWYQDQR